MRSIKRSLSTILLVCVGVLLFGYYALSIQQSGGKDEAEGSKGSRTEKISVGGITRPKSDTVKSNKPRALTKSLADPNELAIERQRRTEQQSPIPLESNKSVALVHGKITSGKSRSIGIHEEPEAFDFEAFKKDDLNRDKYLADVVPNRVYQTAQPGPNVPVLSPVTKSTHVVTSGESVRLQLKSAPNYPVTFVSLDLGTFQNKLNTITVAADAKGIAEVTYSATPGTINRSHIIAGSPGASGQVAFEMQIRAPSATK